MKFFKFAFLLIYLSIFTNLNSEANGSDSKNWCWTKSMANEPNFILNTNEGGLNWGFCQKTQVAPLTKYSAIVNTSHIEKSGSNSVIKIQIFGDKGKTNERMFSSTGFEIGTEKSIEFSDIDVGNVQKLVLKLIGNQGYRCKNIVFKKGNISKNFECLRRIEPCKNRGDPKQCQLELMADGDTPFQITIKTSDDEDAGTRSPLLIQLLGSNGDSNVKIFSELGVEKGSSHTQTINIVDVGEVTGYKLILGGAGKWKPIYMTVTNIVNTLMKNFEIPNSILISPGKDSITFNESDKDSSNNSNNPSKNENSDNEPDNIESDSLNVHDPDGGLIHMSEKNNIISLSCEDKLINPSQDKIIFGPDYPTRNINYMKILARCPSDCHLASGTVYGIGIHPDISSICLSAIVDKAMSFYGGIISISIFPGMDSYKIPSNFHKKINQIMLKDVNSKSIMKSFVVSKVDNIDLVEKDLRIVDNNGKLASEGRLEIRREGVWGSICTFGNSRETASIVCKNLGYFGGEWKSPTDESSRDFCRHYKGFDYCGAEGSLIHYEKIICSTFDTHLNSCNKDLADYKRCNHGFDSIINCFNEIYDTNIPIPVGVVRLNAITNDKETFIGRLEMYNEQKFSPICNLGFNNESANIACKQMGYIKGEMASNKIALNHVLRTDSNSKFSASEVECRGDEVSLKQCKSKLKDINCKHELDVVVKCHGNKGDSTGKSQYMPKHVTHVPELGKLGFTRQKIDCSHKGNNLKFRGDPGSVFLLDCPGNCSREPGLVSGTGLYTSDSSICLAAIHSGVIDDQQGGIFALIKSFGQVNFVNSTRNSVYSSQLNLKWATSFSVSQVNSGWLNMNKIFEEGISSHQIPASRSSFIQLSKDSESSIPKPVFSFMEPNPNFVFKDGSNFYFEGHDLSQYNKYSILTRFKLNKFKGDNQYVFSYSGCSGFNILIDKADKLIIGNICSSNERINTKIMVPLNESVILYVKYEKGLLTVMINSEKLGTIRREIKTKLEIKPDKSVGIGRIGSVQQKYNFYGEINFFNLYDAIIEEKMIPAIQDLLSKGSVKSNIKLTVDGRACVTPCLDSKPGEGNPPKEAKIDKSEEIPTVNKYNTQKKSNEKTDTDKKVEVLKDPQGFGTYDKTQENNQETMQIDCATNLLDKRFNGAAGKAFRVHCQICNSEKAVIFGTGIYHPLSPICKAASHDGILKPDQKGDIIVEIVGAQKVFNGSTGKDKSVSASFAGADKSFKIKSASKLKTISCEGTAAEDIFQGATTSATFVIKCPSNCSNSKSSVIFGSEIYSDDSSICLAAIHCGVLNDNGGEVQFIIDGEQSSFKSTRSFGVTSKNRDSYIRSFRFLGHKSLLSFNFKEDYHGKLQDKWKIYQERTALDKNKDTWNYKKENRPNLSGVSEEFYAIMHSGTARISQNTKFASMITLKDAEFSNGIIKFNIKFIDLNPIGIIFRYSNNENYYSIMFSPKDKIRNVKFISKVNSSVKIVESKFLSMIQIDMWLRCTLIYNHDSMKFLMQHENAREHKLVFSKEVSEISRGTIGIGNNGNNHFYVSGITISEYKENIEIKSLGKLRNTRSWEELLKKTKKRDIKHSCVEVYEKNSPGLERCMEPHSFCQMKCDIHIPKKQEPILNFKCYKDCVKTIYNNNSVKSEEKFANTKVWIPTEGVNVDFLVSGETYYRSGKIVSIYKKMKKSMLKIEYMNNQGAKAISEILYPSTRVTKCGEKLSKRKDCIHH